MEAHRVRGGGTRHESSGHRRPRKPCPHPAFCAGGIAAGQSHPKHQRGFLEMDQRKVSQPRQVCMAGGLWRIQRRSFAHWKHDPVYPEPTGTSSQTDIRRRIYFVLEEERHGIRRTLRIWIKASVVPTGLKSFGILPSAEALGYNAPPPWGWCIVSSSLSYTYKSRFTAGFRLQAKRLEKSAQQW